MAARMIKVNSADGGEFKAYASSPATGSGIGLVLLQEIFGINEYMRVMADRFAAEGYLVLVPDLFWRLEPGVDLGYGEADRAKAMDLYRRFDIDRAIDDAGAAVRLLRDAPENTGRVGALGYCLGGSLAFLTAARAEVDCAVGYYPVAVTNYLQEAVDIQCPVTFHCAEKDHMSPPDAIDRLRQALSGHKDAVVYSYPNVDHAFATPSRPTYDERSAALAYSRTLDALRSALGPTGPDSPPAQ